MGRRRDDDDDRERPSWREIDKMRDGSRHTRGSRESYQERTLRSDWAKKQHLKEAEKFFRGIKGSESYKAAHAALHEKYGTAEFPEALRSFLDQFGLPDDWGTLMFILDAGEPKWVPEALKALKEMYGQRSLIEQRALKSKLKALATTTRDKELRRQFAATLEGL